MKEFEFPSAGAGTIRAYRWEPKGAPRGVVQLVHGVAEYATRYNAFARFLTEKGYVVVAEDHMGHGHSTGTGAQLHFVGGWEAVAEDVHTLLCRTQAEFPELPYFIFGHSMGSFLTRTVLCRWPEARLNGAVICGTGWQPTAVLCAGRAVCALERLRLGEKGHSKLLHSLMFGAYNKKFPDARTPNDWVCSDASVVDRYTADPLCGGKETVTLAREMLRGIGFIQKNANLRAMNRELPILFVAGKSDPVGNMGKGVEKTRDRFVKAGMKRVECKLYDGRHEILNEPNRAEVYEDVVNFLEKL